MALSIQELRRKAQVAREQKQRIKEQNKVKGRFGELIVRNLFKSTGFEVLDICQEWGTKKKWTVAEGKRPDFCITPLKPDGSDDGTPFIADAKCHTIGDDGLFSIGKGEMNEYRATMQEWGAEQVFFCLVPANDPTQMILVSDDEMHDDGRGSMVVDLGTLSGRSLPLSRADYDLAISELALEGFDVSLAPVYPA